MGVRVNRIEKEFVLKKIIEKETPVRLLSMKKEIIGKITKFCDKFLTIDCLESEISHFHENEEVNIFFLFENNQHTFSTKIIEIKESNLIIAQPELTYKNLQRQFERIKSTEDILVIINIKGKRIQINFPKTDNYVELTEPAYTENFDLSNIKNLIVSFRDKIQDVVSINKIIMLRNSNPSTYEEKIMAKTGKTIWIPNIEEGFIIKKSYPEVSLLSYQDMIDYELETGTLQSETNKKLDTLIEEKIDKGFYSQLYSPLLYNEFFIGYIYLCNLYEKRTEISIDILNYVNEFSKILCYSLKSHHYFKSKEFEDTSHATPVIDISGSGLLFAHRDQYLSVDFPLHSEIMITLKIGKRKIEIKSIIIRKYTDKDTHYIALHFSEITREDFRYLYEFIYGKKYSTEDATV